MATMPKKAAKTPAADLMPLPTDFVAEVTEAVEASKESVAEFDADVRAAVEKGVGESRAALEQAKVSADEAATAFQQSYAAARDGVIAINAKALEALRVNAEANFNFMKAAFAVKSLPDLIALQSEFTRKQVDALTVQTKDIGALTQKTVTSAMEPIKEQVAKSFKIAV
jgi:hypothetical protein